MDAVIGVRKPDDYEEEQGARFIVVHEKHRGYSGKDAESIEVQMFSDAATGTTWTWRPIVNALRERARELASAGMTQREIAQALKVSLSTVNRILKA
jgi:DNA-binding NarL/FixJ family response regulator